MRDKECAIAQTRSNVTIIIASYNAVSILMQCLRNLRTAGLLDTCDVIVVDNASSDSSVALVRSQFHSVSLIENKDNRWFAGACNQGAEKANSPYLLFLNSDAFPAKGAIEALVDFLSSASRNSGCAGPARYLPGWQNANGRSHYSGYFEYYLHHYWC